MFAKSKNQLWKESGTSLSFKDWIERESKKGNFAPKDSLNASGNEDLLDTKKLEDTIGIANIANPDKFETILGIKQNTDSEVNKNNVLGLNKWVLIVSVLAIAGAVGYKLYTKKK